MSVLPIPFPLTLDEDHVFNVLVLHVVGTCHVFNVLVLHVVGTRWTPGFLFIMSFLFSVVIRKTDTQMRLSYPR